MYKNIEISKFELNVLIRDLKKRIAHFEAEVERLQSEGCHDDCYDLFDEIIGYEHRLKDLQKKYDEWE